jgi:hypothetical protein
MGDHVLAAPTLWITVRRASEAGRRCRDYAVHDPAGAVLLKARAFVWDRVLAVTSPGGQPVLLLRRRLSFPLTGRVDVRSAPGGSALGAVYRSGPRSPRARAGESVLAGLADALTGSDGSQLSRPTALVCTMGDQPAGTLALAPLPWPEEAEASEPPALVAAALRLAPARARRLMKQLGRPSGWRFQREPPLLAVEPLLTIGAALFQVELSHW